MSTLGLIEYKDASAEVRAIYDDIMATRKTDWINNFWKAIAHDPATLKRTWEDIKQIMAPGALDPLTKEMIYVAVSVTNQCHYCIATKPTKWSRDIRSRSTSDSRAAVSRCEALRFYFELRFAARFEGGTTPFSGRSFSITSESLCSGLSPAEDDCGPVSGTLSPCATFIASLKVDPDFAAATANTPCGFPLLKTVAI